MSPRLLILDTVVEVVIRTTLVFSWFLLFSGHNAPGGGFVAGLVAGICLVLRYVAAGRDGMSTLVRLRPDQLLGAGLGLALLTGAAGWLWGTGFLESAVYEIELPWLGAVKASSALIFDIGVFTVVVGLTAALIGALGDSEEPLL